MSGPSAGGTTLPPRHALLAVALAAVGGVACAASLHTDDFESGSAGWNSGGSTVAVVSDGGPTGDGDAFLQVDTTTRLAARNSLADWIGDFTSVDAFRVTADLMVPQGEPPLEIRLVLFGSGFLQAAARWTTVESALAPADGQWRTYEFSLAENDLVLVSNSGAYSELMEDVGQVMLRHDRGAPSAGGAFVAGTLGVDNVTLAAAPIPGDFSDDGVVDGRDLLLWQREPSVGLLADWESSFGMVRSLAATSHSVPEPASISILLVAVALCRKSNISTKRQRVSRRKPVHSLALRACIDQLRRSGMSWQAACALDR